MPLLKILLPFLFFFASPTLLAQKNNVPDSLKMLSYKDIVKRYYKYEKDSLKTKLYAKAYLEKGKAENNFQEIFNGYHFMSHSNLNNNLKIIYMDSMVFISKKNNNNQFIAKGYFIKGNEYNRKSNYINAIDNYILADKFAKETTDNYLVHCVKINIAIIRSVQGFQREAIPVFLSCEKYFKGINNYYYLNSLFGLGICYNKINQYNLADKYYQFGIKESLRLNDSGMQDYFIYGDGMNEYSKKNYPFAIEKLSKVLPTLISNEDTTNLAIAHFYIGKSYYDLRETEKAIEYFLKVDSLFVKTKDIYPDLREGYEILINYYKNRNDKDKQLIYVEKLLEVDKVLNKNFKHFARKITKEYDTIQLRKEKLDIERTLEYNKVKFLIVLIILSLFLLIILYIFYIKQKKYKTRYNALIDSIKVQQVQEVLKIEATDENEDELKDIGISEEIIKNVLHQLDLFENKRMYLQKDCTQSKVANLIQTNSSYLSKIVNTFKKKKFTTYINELRIDYIIKELQVNPKMRLYTIKAIAEEIGFNNAESFSKAFYNKTGIYPSYFLNKLKNNSM